ncbi:MAG: cellobiose phosphorylase [Lachnospiraceae bacterium]|nr:cellobiose phosphorylase [Lachnospiraceae bacterium]
MNYKLSGDKFIIEDYTNVSPFSSFLPGIAGVNGIPIWAFYCNRGQGINSFGINHKGDAIMEFNSANTAFENTPIKGFRSFVKVNGEFFEPFCTYSRKAVRRMEIEKNVLTIIEENHGLRITVSYIILPKENIGALLRNVSVKNISDKMLKVEMLDGMAQIIPYGIQNGQYKEMSNLFKSWADVKNKENEAPLFVMRSSSDDSSEVSEIEGGYFYFAIKDGEKMHIICDKKVVFGEENSMTVPANFIEKEYSEVLCEKECHANKVPCAFATLNADLTPGEVAEFSAFAGFAASVELLNKKSIEFSVKNYTDRKITEARELCDKLTADVKTHTGNSLYDKYIEQCYLDNFLRGGYPFVFKSNGGNAVVHLFSRKHGDPERDYNFFSTAGEFYSQGNGNYRDVCQNRRHDVFFNPEIGDFNVYQFYSMIQADGYNPLEIRPSTFLIKESLRNEASKLIALNTNDTGDLAKLLCGSYTPGQVTNVISKNDIKVRGSESELVEKLIAMSEEQLEAGFGEGYWSDHWDYNLDLIEDYLRIYPEKFEELVFGNNKYRFYNSPVKVRDRAETYVYNKGKIRQYGSVAHVDKKTGHDESFDGGKTNWLKNSDGSYAETNLFGKLVTLALNKFTLLDNEQLGIEMEGGKPGWNDAMNGLPGLFGSSMPETVELLRTVSFIRKALEGRKGKATLPQEIVSLYQAIKLNLEASKQGMALWEELCKIREKYRTVVMYNLTGEQVLVSYEELSNFFTLCENILENSVNRALEIGKGILPTYFTYEAVKFIKMTDDLGNDVISPYGLPSVKVLEFRRNELPYFLEGPARFLSCGKKDRIDENRKLFEEIKKSDLYDKKLKMYKTSESIEKMSIENGRVRAFTPGWLERESIFLHMEYKYFLGLFKSGLYDEFFTSIKDGMIPFQDPSVYKRSILENSSFIASSANPDPTVHGQGFVARLSGSTVEALSMWIGMFEGNGGFFVDENGKLALKFAPVLSKEMFDENNEAGFTMCGKTKVVYVNKSGKNTYDTGVKVRSIHLSGGVNRTIDGEVLPEEFALLVRNGKIKEIKAVIE